MLYEQPQSLSQPVCLLLNFLVEKFLRINLKIE